jgi:pimeloyl-ACP methyl ester carboxylesterase
LTEAPGSSEPVLLLHGQPGSAGDWDGVRKAIAGRRPTVAPDRPGWDGVSPVGDLEGNARAAVGALDRASSGRAVVAGHSLGGAVAAWLAASQPERVSALVLISPAANVQSLVAIDHLLAAPVIGELASAAALAAAGAALATGPLRRLISSDLGLDAGYLDRASRRLLMPRTWGSFVSEQRMLIRQLPELEARLGRITAPTTIVAGTADRQVPLASARRLAGQIPQAELIEIRGATHLLPLQHPRRVAEIILGAG